MDDFASAAMLRVLAAGMAALGLPSPAVPAPRAGARVALADKRTLVAQAAAQAGLAGLVKLGQGVHRLRDDPLHAALVGAPSPAVLFERWSRLERYVHSRHRVVLRALQARSAQLLHAASRPGEAPLAAESLVVLGLLIALLEAAGVQGLEVRAGAARAWPSPDELALQQAASAGRAGDWRLSWRSMAVASAAAAPPPHLPPADAAEWPRPVPQALAQLVADPMRAWTVAALAGCLGLTARSYQRQLASAGLGHRELLARARCRCAAGWLMQREPSLAQIGFLCGWADQAHFTRQFALRVGLTPGQYRAAFAAGRASG